MSDRRIKHTKNYKLFERMDDNRILDAAKRHDLMQSMRTYGWIPSFPAVCKLMPNGSIGIKDGQHRFAIAETLGIDVFYVIEDIDFDIALVNQAQRCWKILDYAQRFAAAGNQNYRDALDFRERNRLPVGIAFALMAGHTNFGNITAEFRSGTYKIRDRQWAEKVASVYVPLSNASKSVRNSRCLEACMAICRISEFEVPRMLRNLERCREKLVAYSTRMAYLDMLEEIYNFRRHAAFPLKIKAINEMKKRNAAEAAREKKQARLNSRMAAEAVA